MQQKKRQEEAKRAAAADAAAAVVDAPGYTLAKARKRKQKIISTGNSKTFSPHQRLYCVCRTPYDESKSVTSTIWSCDCQTLAGNWVESFLQVLHWVWSLFKLVPWGVRQHSGRASQVHGFLCVWWLQKAAREYLGGALLHLQDTLWWLSVSASFGITSWAILSITPWPPLFTGSILAATNVKIGSMARVSMWPKLKLIGWTPTSAPVVDRRMPRLAGLTVSWCSKTTIGNICGGSFEVSRYNLHSLLSSIALEWQIHNLESWQAHKMSWPFLEPVDPAEVPDYYTVIKDPMGEDWSCFFSCLSSCFLSVTCVISAADLSTIDKKIDLGHYTRLGDLIKDIMQMFDNCRYYNPADSAFYQCAEVLETFFVQKLKTLQLKLSNESVWMSQQWGLYPNRFL